jgi:hypothetical protein
VSQSCKTCALFDAAAAMDARGRILASRNVRCFWKSTEPYPTSIGYPGTRPVATYTSSNKGTDCLCYTRTSKAEDA